MKLSEILNEVRDGKLILSLKVKDASKIISNTNGFMTISTTIFQKKYIEKSEYDEIVNTGSKEINVSIFKHELLRYSGLEIIINVQGKFFEGTLIDDTNYRLLVTINGNPDSIWQGFTEVCKVFNLPYHSLKDKPYPRKYGDISVIKLPFRSR